MRARVQGRVYVLAFANEQGDVVRAKVLKVIEGRCDEAALVVFKRTKCTPGKLLKTRISIPIELKLTR